MRDDGRPSLASTTRVVISVADINDHGPEFEQKFYTVQIPASPSTDKPLFQVRIPRIRAFFDDLSPIFVILSDLLVDLGHGIALSPTPRCKSRNGAETSLPRFLSPTLSLCTNHVEASLVSCCIYYLFTRREKPRPARGILVQMYVCQRTGRA